MGKKYNNLHMHMCMIAANSIHIIQNITICMVVANQYHCLPFINGLYAHDQ